MCVYHERHISYTAGQGKRGEGKLEHDNISPWRKFMLAMEYEKVAEYTFKIIEVSLLD